jgi:hypothetical protein
VNPLLTAALISAFVTVAGAGITFYSTRRSSTDHRLDTLLEQLVIDNASLRVRMDASERDRNDMHQNLLNLRATLTEQSAELYIIRARETDLRAWAREVMAWCALAIGTIHGLNGTIPDPPPLPHVYGTEPPEETK